MTIEEQGYRDGVKAAYYQDLYGNHTMPIGVVLNSRVDGRVGPTITDKPDGEQLLPVESWGGRFADYLYPFSYSFSARRAGKATAMAEAQGYEAPWSVRLPATMSVLSMLGGSVAGAAIGGLLNNALGVKPGGILGGHLGLTINNFVRRNHIKGIRDGYDRSESIEPVRPNMSYMKSVLAPLAGPHRHGMAKGYEALSGQTDPKETGKRNLLHTAYIIPGGVGAVANLLGSPVEGFKAVTRVNKARENVGGDPDVTPSQQRKEMLRQRYSERHQTKGASLIMCLAG